MELLTGIVRKSNNENIKNGWIVKICKEDDMKGYLLLFINPHSKEGYDEWLQFKEDVYPQLNIRELEVAWEKPIESILEEESNNLKQK